jgi:demethylmenaquinone methyltransferase/2-methoxy-6-polyprenyl-1,4-benzoquinol methylase
MNLFDFIAPVYEILHLGTKKSFKTLWQLGQFQKTDKILDLGGGTGRISKFFVDKAKEIIVLDSSSGMIKKCRNHSGLTCVFGLAEQIPFPDNYFDKIIIVDAFHHFQNQEIVCQEIKRVLKQNGKLLIEEFNPKTMIGGFIVLIEKLLKMKSNFYSPKELSVLFAKYLSSIKIFNDVKARYYLIGEKI